jgi:DegV family protein with EDD domain
MDLSPEQREGLALRLIPLTFQLDGQSYRSGVDIQPDEFYDLLARSEELPTTSQPSAGEFAALYRELAATDPTILSLHISSGLSGTVNAAQAGARLVPEADVVIVDTKTLSGAEGWQVEAAARAAQAGWSRSEIVDLVGAVSAATDTLFTLSELDYLIHGGRISHLKGLIASVLNIKPVIGVEKVGGTYVQRGQARTFNHAVKKLVATVTKQYAPGTALRVQVMHAANPQAAERLQAEFEELFDCTWLPTSSIAPVLGAHTGPTLVGAAFAPLADFPTLPER